MHSKRERERPGEGTKVKRRSFGCSFELSAVRPAAPVGFRVTCATGCTIDRRRTAEALQYLFASARIILVFTVSLSSPTRTASECSPRGEGEQHPERNRRVGTTSVFARELPRISAESDGIRRLLPRSTGCPDGVLGWLGLASLCDVTFPDTSSFLSRREASGYRPLAKPAVGMLERLRWSRQVDGHCERAAGGVRR